MTHTLIIYNQKKLIISALALIAILFPLNLIIAIAYLNALSCVIGCVLIIPLVLIISSRISKSVLDISLNENSIQFGDTKILLSDIDGYYINKESPTMTQIEFRDTKNNDFSFTSLSFGQTGKDFKSFLSDFLKFAQLANGDLKQYSYYDFHKKQYSYFKRAIYVDLVIVILVNLFYVYLIFFRNVPFNWKLLFLNSIFVGRYTFHKNNERVYKNKKTTANTV